ncbi:ubiquinone biosynthesis protein UbiB [Sphaerisporangium krabiense]|uniref:Ubiquinone biosynthesis protein n=1 Tax=Sphaerisporangium krabiense TaxID=763782 RepID=A0A7W8ZAF5_9ACTN|nr:AarF/UbiB family protein [Sphaerisporangium krabiense]MBB5630447.1 ubiquinone biosynthesis protein [Sphaerisporangium krabiense]GII62600.1 ubiquinone biosynthesis protein UbiB [Sphaerisporangium krabiense]
MDFVGTLVIVVAILVLIGLFSLVARRLLDLRFGLVRAFVAGALAYLLAGPLAQALAGSVPLGSSGITPLWFLILAVACALLAAMTFLAIAEALVPTGSVPGPIELARSLRGRVVRSRRYFAIVGVLVRHGLGPYLRGRSPDVEAPSGRARLARSLRGALDDAGVTFVKLGQILSTRPDLLSPEFIDELTLLRDRASPAPWDEVEGVLAAELPGPLEEVFPEFDRRPLASASIAQVYAARLRSGERVVVKVQRPGIADVVERDLDIMARLAASLEVRTRWGRALGVRDLVRGFADALREELDFRVEAANMTAVAAVSAGTAVHVPAVHAPLCGRRVLVMERLDGSPLGEDPAPSRAPAPSGEAADPPPGGPEPAAGDADRSELARTLLEALLRQIMLDGVFHADPHPGNIMLLADGRLGLLDFGSVGRLDAGLRASLQRLLLAMDRGDPLGVSDALLEVVPRPGEIDEPRLERELGRFMARHLNHGPAGGVRMFTDLFRIVSGHGLAVPPEVAAVFRTLATVEGTLTGLAPGFDLIGEARAFAGRHFAERRDPAAIRKAATDELAALLPMLRRLPRRVERIVGAAEQGRLTVNVRLLADERDRRHVTGMLHQVLLTVLAATTGLMAVLLLGVESGPKVTAAVTLYQLLAYNLLVVAAVLALRVLVLIFRRDL